MADNIQRDPLPPLATDDIDGVHYPRTKLIFGADGITAGDVSAANPLPVTVPSMPLPAGASTEATLAALKGVADSLLLAAQAIRTATEAINGKTTAVNTGAITGTVAVSNFTDNGLTDTQLRASPVPVSGTVAANTGLTQPLTDDQLRAGPVPVSAATLPLPAGAAQDATAQAIEDLTDTMLYLLSALLEKMPTPAPDDSMRASLYTGGNRSDTPWFVAYCNSAVGNPNTGAGFYRQLEPWHFSASAAAPLYNQITVS